MSYSPVDVNNISGEHTASMLTVEEAEKYGTGTDRKRGDGAEIPGLKLL